MWPSIIHYQIASDIIASGGVVSYPTESVFGLGCDPHQLDAVEKILHLKRRPWQKGLILIASAPEQLDAWVDWSRVPNLSEVLGSWPGPETWIVPVSKQVSPLLRGQFDSLAVRVSAHPVVKQLCDYWGSALVSTSANTAGMREARRSFDVRRLFQNNVDYYMPGDTGARPRPSRIRDARTGRVIRA